MFMSSVLHYTQAFCWSDFHWYQQSYRLPSKCQARRRLVSEYDSGEGLPYAPVDWPNVGDKWGWRTGKRATNSGTFKDRYLYLPECFHAPKDGKKNAFRSKTSVKKYLQSEYLGMDID
ncbi:hypothetical protein KY284_027130 [Solanum tuberosum]|nr:hypothetical protein KY284_027130 [Solanum tuberosum]